MKLRNKKTGKIEEFGSVQLTQLRRGEIDIFNAYKSIIGLNEEWEDYEEPQPKETNITRDEESKTTIFWGDKKCKKN